MKSVTGRPPDGRARTGAGGESVACAHLESLGLTIRERNYSSRAGEIDIIAEVPAGASAPSVAGELVFCEVKTRSFQRDAEPMLEAVPTEKRRRLALTALRYCQERRLDCFMRFDVIAVSRGEQGRLRVVEHLPHAFTCEDLRLGG